MIANGIQYIYQHDIFLNKTTLSNIYCIIVLLLKMFNWGQTRYNFFFISWFMFGVQFEFK